MHLGSLLLTRLAIANRRVLGTLLAFILCATICVAPCGKPLFADDTAPVISDFEAHLDGNWIVISGTVDSTGWVHITGITLTGFTVLSGEHFIRQIPYIFGTYGPIFAVLYEFMGLSSEVVEDTI